jgi:hypothetical protein
VTADVIRRDGTPEPPSDRSFGVVFATVFALLALLPLLWGGAFRVWAAALGVAFLVVAFVAPTVLAPLNRQWLRFGLALHRVTSPVLLFLMFVLIFVPVGLVMRVIRRDALGLKFDKSRSSYWVDRETDRLAPRSFDDQF